MKIKHLINYDLMREVMNAPMDYFEQFGKLHRTPDGMMFIERDIGANILAVAHLDSVNPYDHFYVNKFAGDDYVFSTRVDDRLGAYIILYVLPAMGIYTDLLLTEGEEVGKSTAKYFQTDKQYRWMFSFDRKGTDAVHYRYIKSDWTNAMRAAFGKIERGSMSDIDYLSHLKCCGVNVGTGYMDEHHLLACANMTNTINQIGRFIQFYQNNKKIWYEHVEPPPRVYTPPVTNYQPNFVPYKPPVSEEVEEIEIPKFNPYLNVIVDMPLDIDEYVSKEGVITPPEKCAFCLEKLTEENTHVFMGICRDCERWAVECAECEEYYCRTDEPSEDMGRELFYGLCPVCSENWRQDDITRLQRPSEWNWGDDDDYPRLANNPFQ